MPSIFPNLSLFDNWFVSKNIYFFKSDSRYPARQVIQINDALENCDSQIKSALDNIFSAESNVNIKIHLDLGKMVSYYNGTTTNIWLPFEYQIEPIQISLQKLDI